MAVAWTSSFWHMLTIVIYMKYSIYHYHNLYGIAFLLIFSLCAGTQSKFVDV
jgi:hypothetical protein